MIQAGTEAIVASTRCHAVHTIRYKGSFGWPLVCPVPSPEAQDIQEYFWGTALIFGLSAALGAVAIPCIQGGGSGRSPEQNEHGALCVSLIL